ncbi:MAG: serine hydrolase [Candidatus Aminicenantes bacterium]|nr:serine hydrolase [Candidatus Aminicenantes bacterium]
MKRSLFLLALSSAIIISGMSGRGDPPPAETEAQAYKADNGPYRFSSADLVLHDTGRGKDLPVRVSYPETEGPLPVILWSHGATGTKDMYQPLVDHWSSHGYVCIQPSHSDSRAFGLKPANSPELFRDWKSRPQDIAFLLDSLDRIGDRIGPLKNRLDALRAGVGGHSFGAHTAQLVAGATTAGPEGRESHTDPRPKAFLLLSPQGIGPASAGLDEDSWKGIDRPYIVITGTRDIGRGGQDWQWRLDPFKHAGPGHRYLLVIDDAWHGFGGLVGGAGFRGAGPDNPDHRLYVKTAAIAFWDAFLKDEEKALAFLQSDALERLSDGRARLDRKTAAPEPPPAPPAGRETAFETVVEDADWLDGTRSRGIPVRIYAPAPAHGPGPFPAVVFSHGGGESRESFTYLGTHWARHGYIVVFLTHEGSDRRAVEVQGLRGLGGEPDAEARPLDLRFAIDRLLSADPGSALLKGRVDAGNLAVAGQCVGSTTALALVGLKARLIGHGGGFPTDPRVKCTVVLSPQPAGGLMAGRLGLDVDSWQGIRVPTMVVTGSRDFNWVPEVHRDPALTRLPFDGLPAGDHYLVEIRDAEHNAFTDSVPYYPARTRDPRHHGWIQRATTAMLDAYLRGSRTALAWLREKRLETETKGECRQEHKLPDADRPVASTAAPAAAAEAATRQGPRSLDFSPVDAFVKESLGRIGGGCCLLLIHGDVVVYRKAFGTFCIEETVPIASATKWLSGGVVMALVDEGKISLDDPISKHLPDLPDEKAGITIRQLFSHTHGLPEQPTPHRNTRLTMAQAVDEIARLPLAHAPGTSLLYGGTGMQVAGRICEIVSGRKWVDLFQEKIGRPLHMTRTDYYAFGVTENPNVAGSIRTCVDDYGRYLRMILNGGRFEGHRILSGEAVRTMLTNQTADLPVLRSACQPYATLDPEFGASRYGIGCWLERLDPATGEAREATSGGAFGCLPFVDLERKIAGVYLPHHRSAVQNHEGKIYNDSVAVFLELRPIIRAVFDGRPLPARRSAPPAAPAKPAARSRARAPEGDAAQQAARMLRFLDRNGDGALSAEEAPDRLKQAFSFLDRDRDGKLSRPELVRGIETWQKRGGGARPAAGRPSTTPLAKKDPGMATPPGLYAVGTAEVLTLRDDSRGRTIPLRVRFPQGGESHPVILFSHCVNGSRDDFRPLVEHWVSHGYVCLQPDHADSRLSNAEGPPLDWRNRAQDLVFLLDSLGQIQESRPELKGRMDAGRIGAAGHLIGAYAASLLAGMRVFPGGIGGETVTYHDDRVKAALLLSPQGRGQGLTEESWAMIDRPMLVVAGSETPSRRTGNPPEWRAEPFQFSPPGSKYLLWVEGLKREYAGLATGQIGDPAMAASVLQTTLLFWDAHLKDQADARETLKSRVRVKDEVDR